MRAAAAAAGAIALAAVAGPRAATPQTAYSGQGRVAAVAQDGQLLAWLDGDGTGCNTVRVVGARGVTMTAPQPASGSMTCHWDVGSGKPWLALAAGASSVLWTLHEGGGAPLDYVMTASLGGPEVRVDRLSHASDGTGLWLGGVAGAGTTLVYSFVDVELVDKIACLSGGSCRKTIAGGGIRLVSNGRATPLPGSPPALELAAAAGRLAYVPATSVNKKGAPAARAGAPVEVVDATTGDTCTTARPGGMPLAIALSRSVLAVLSRSNGHVRLWWYAIVQRGQAGCEPVAPQLGSAAVPAGTTPELAVSNRLIVYRVARTLHGIRLPSGVARTLARTKVPPLDFSLAGSRLAWAENRKATSRVRTLAVG